MMYDLLSTLATWLYWTFAILLLLAVFLIIATYLAPTHGALFFYLRIGAYVYLGSLICLLSMPIIIFRPRDVDNIRLVCVYIAYITRLYGITWEMRGAEYLKTYPGTTDHYKDGAVIVSNHQSELDVLGMFNVWPSLNRCTPVAKSELFWVWPFGLAAWLAGVVFINRSKSKECIQALQQTAAAMKKQKTKVFIFPEGTRNKGSSSLLAFRKGAFRTAVQAQCPIIPVVFSPYYFINYKDKSFAPGHMVIQALPPVPTEGLGTKDVDLLMTSIRNSMVEMYLKLYKESTGKDFVDYKPLENGKIKKVL